MNKSIKLNNVYYTLINNKTKKASILINVFNNSNLEDIYTAYNRPSGRKIYIYNYWQDRAIELKSFSRGIISHNSMVFCYAFDFEYHGKSYIAYITPSHNYLIEK